MQSIPTQPQSGAPLQVTVQFPPVQSVILQACALWQVSWQPPAAQSIVQEPPVQSWMQSPEVPGHDVAHEVVLLQVWWQSPPGHTIVQEPPVQSWMQSPSHWVVQEAEVQV